MKRKTLLHFWLLLLCMIVGGGTAWAQDVSYDFTGSDWTVSNSTLSNGTVSFTGAGGANFKMNDGYFMLGKSGAYINFPKYSSAVEKIVVTGRSAASGSVGQNIYVGDQAVSTATTGATGANTYMIASGYQAAGTQYTLKVTSNHNTQITKIEIYYASGTPTTYTVTFDAGAGTFVGNTDFPNTSNSKEAGTYTLPSATPASGYTFDGWTTASNNETVTGSYNVSGDVDFTAKYTQQSSGDGNTVTLTQSILGLTGSYTTNTEITIDGITYVYTDLMKNNDNIQAKASSGTIKNSTAFPGAITSVAITHSGTARATTINGSSDGTNWTLVATGDGSITADFSGKGYKYFQIKRGSSAAYWTKIEITYSTAPEKAITNLSYTGTPTKTVYNSGESFDPTGLTVTATFDDNSSENVTTSVTWTPNPLTVGTTSVTGTYREKTITVSGITVNAAPGSAEKPYTVAEARAAIDEGTGVTGVYATGIVSEIVTAYNSDFGNISYNISTDGLTTSDQLQAYRGKSYNGDEFTSSDDIQVGDVVVVYGNLTKYNDTYEFGQNNQLVKLTRPENPAVATTVSIDATGITNTNKFVSTAAGTLTATVATVDGAPVNGATVTWTSSKEDVATIDANGNVTLVGAGITTITASYAGVENQYKASSDTYQLTVINQNPNPQKENFELFSGDLEEGDYLIVYDGGAMKASVSNSRLDYTDVTATDDIIETDQEDIVWHIAQSGDYWTIYNANGAKYAASTGAANKAQLLAEGTDDKALWTVTGSETYDFANKANDASNINSYLRRNTTYGFACYASSTGGALSLYKKVDGTNTSVKTVVTINSNGITNTNKFVSEEAGTLTATVATVDGAPVNGATVTWSSSEEDVATIDANGKVTLVAAGTTTMKASYAGKQGEYKASWATYELTVINKDPNANDGTAEKPYTVAEARAAIDANEGITGVHVKGIVSKVDKFDENNGYITYYISTDGSTEADQLQAYKGKGIEGANFTSADDILEGDIVVIKGNLTLYNKTIYEFEAGNQLVSRITKKIPTLAFGAESYTVAVDGDLTITATSNSTGAITYTSSNTDVADIDAETGEVLAYQAGETTITATIAATENYGKNTATVTLTVTDGRQPVTTITALAPTTVYVGQSGTFTLTENKLGDATYSYVSDDDDILLVDGAEYVGIGEGEVTVTVTATPTSENYTVVNFETNVTVSYKYAAPTIEDAAFTSTYSVDIPAINGAIIYYTTDGTVPTEKSTVYTQPIELTITTTIKAIAIDADGCVSPVATATYTKEAVKKDEITLIAGQPLTFSDFSDLGNYANDRTDYLLASDGNAYKWTGNQYCYNPQNKALQMRAKGNNNGTGTINSCTINSAKGFTLTLTYTNNSTPTVYEGEEALTATSSTETSAVYDIESTSTAITIEAGSKATYVTSIAFAVKKLPSTLTFADDAQTVAIGADATYTATASREGAITYTSSDEDIAMVDETTGMVMGVAEGTVTITATLAENDEYEGATASYELTVYDNSKILTELSFEKESYEVLEGQTLQVVATVTNGYDGTLEYSSSDENIATVDANGTVTGVAKGSVIITVTAPATNNYSSASATYTLNVTRLEDVFVLDNTRGWENATEYTGDTGTYAMLIPEKGTNQNAPKYYSSGTATRFYNGNTLTISSASMGIKSVTFNINSGTYAVETNGYTKSTSSNVFTAEEDKAANRVVFSFSATTQVNSITVTYCDVETAEFVDVKLAASGYASYCSPFALDLTPTEDYAAWAVTNVEGTEVTFTKIEGAVPAETPFILYGQNFGGQTATLPIATGETTAIADNMLKGTLKETEVSTVEGDYTNFGLSGGKFVKIKDGVVKANKAYLPILTDNVPAGARLNIVFADEATGIKVIDDSQFTIDNAFFDLQGRRIQQPTKGLYIKQGKKLYVK